jgi:hypothetical protein
MKAAIGSKPYAGPWGGGNRVVSVLCDALAERGHKVVHALDDADIDFIVMIDPRVRSPNVCFGAGAILRYLAFRNPNAIVIHRINECDERKNEPFINRKLARANYVADATVFVGEWLTRLPLWRQHLRSPWFVIRNGSDKRIFNSRGYQAWRGEGPLKLVTHHWGNHPMKGFDVYAALDSLLADPVWRARLDFTYVGNLPKGFAFKNSRYVPPLDGEALAAELRSHQVYITGSQNEPGGNHQNEGALCGLPLIYRTSGALPEYCQGFGVPFSGPADLVETVGRMMREYPRWVAEMPRYQWTAERMTQEWIALFESLLQERAAIVAHRRLWRNPLMALGNLISDAADSSRDAGRAAMGRAYRVYLHR